MAKVQNNKFGLGFDNPSPNNFASVFNIKDEGYFYYRKIAKLNKLFSDIKNAQTKSFQLSDYVAKKNILQDYLLQILNNEIKTKLLFFLDVPDSTYIIDVPNNKKEKETIVFKLFLSSFDGVVDFKNYHINFQVTEFGHMEYQFIFYFKEIDGKRIPKEENAAVVISMGNGKNFNHLLKYLGKENYTTSEDLYLSYLDQFYAISNSSKLELPNFYANVPKEILERIKNEKGSLENMWAHFFYFLTLKTISEKIENGILSLIGLLAINQNQLNNEQGLKNGLDIFLLRLLNFKNNGKTGFHILYFKMNDYAGKPNFTKYIQSIYFIWLFSSFSKSEHSIYAKYIKSPDKIAYKNDKVLSFNSSEFKFDLKNNEVKVNRSSSSLQFHKDYEKGTILAHISLYGIYHIFQPLQIIELTEKDALADVHNIEAGEKLKLPASIVPAFFLAAINEQKDWENFNKSLWLSFDVALTFTGIVNVLKFRHLRHISKLAKFKLFIGIVEFSSSSIRILLELLDSCSDLEVCTQVKHLLALLEIASGGVDALVSLSTAKIADDLLQNEEKIRKAVKNKADADEIIDVLDNLAYQDIRKTALIHSAEYEVLSNKLLLKYINEMVQLCRKMNINLEIKWINKNHKEYYTGLLGRLGTSSTNKKLLVLELRNPCPKITLNHERWHLEDFIEMGWKRYRKMQEETPWLLEELVWNRIYKYKSKWKEKELIDSYKYYKKYCKERGIKPTINEKMEKLIKNI